jgi:hypothetical protein
MFKYHNKNIIIKKLYSFKMQTQKYNTLKEKYNVIIADSKNVKEHTNLLNKAYDREDSWTDKTLVIKLDQRITEEELENLYKKEKNISIILIDKDTNKYVSCAMILYDYNSSKFEKFIDMPFFAIELFCTDPDLQSQGLGKYIFLLSEKIMKISSLYHNNNNEINNNSRDNETLLYKEIEEIKENINSLYNTEEEFFRKIENYANNIKNSKINNKGINNVLLKVIMYKKGLYDFYIRAGYFDTGVKESLKEVFSEDMIIIDSCFVTLNKKINDIDIKI